MCDQCGNGPTTKEWKSAPSTPERMAEIQKDRADTILDHGHQVLGIFDNETGTRFYYSVGRGAFDKEELLLTGQLPPPVATFIINEAARLIDDGTIVLDPQGMVEVEKDVLLQGFPCRIIPCDPKAGEMHQALNIDPNLRAYQIIWPDTNGYWPDEAGWDSRFTQPVYALV